MPKKEKNLTDGKHTSGKHKDGKHLSGKGKDVKGAGSHHSSGGSNPAEKFKPDPEDDIE
jgi:hypothetical protein